MLLALRQGDLRVMIVRQSARDGLQYLDLRHRPVERRQCAVHNLQRRGLICRRGIAALVDTGEGQPSRLQGPAPGGAG